MKTKFLILILTLLFFTSVAQLENIFVEKIAVSQAAATADENLTTSHITYRIFVDMAEGYGFQLVQGAFTQPLIISTTTSFYNDENDGVLNPADIRPLPTMDEALYYDSWITIGGYSSRSSASQIVPLSEDTDGTVDGFLAGEVALQYATSPGLDLSMFDYKPKGENLNVEDASIYVGGEISGAGASNSVCIGQFTTDGDFSFELNVQIRNVSDPSLSKLFIARVPNTSFQVQSDLCIYPSPSKKGCTNSQACNYDSEAVEDDGSCEFAEENCIVCITDAPYFEKIDTDGDGICDAKEIPGCTNSDACNYDRNATDDDGSCLLPEMYCSKCDGNGGLEMIDYDNDGICNKDDDTGCKNNPLSCNYNSYATSDDGSCDDGAETGCSSCSHGELILISDYDKDGICNKNDLEGCTDPLACNYFEGYQLNDDNCTYSDKCYACIEHELALIDENNNGVCDSDEVSNIFEYNDGNGIKVSVFPNPFENVINLKIENCEQNTDYTIVVSSLDGLELFSQRIYTTKPEIHKEVNLNKLPGGNYVISIYSMKGKIASQVVTKQ